MSRPARYVLVAVPACVAAVCLIAACASTRNPPPGAPAATDPGTGPAAKPSFGMCGMCHIDVVDEVASTRHVARGIDCVKCHGPSRAHIQDENNEAKPDRLFTRATIDAFCGGCHDCLRPSATDPPPDPKPPAKVCTDCHNAHNPPTARPA